MLPISFDAKSLTIQIDVFFASCRETHIRPFQVRIIA
jgi:hypothetical protein